MFENNLFLSSVNKHYSSYQLFLPYKRKKKNHFKDNKFSNQKVIRLCDRKCKKKKNREGSNVKRLITSIKYTKLFIISSSENINLHVNTKKCVHYPSHLTNHNLSPHGYIWSSYCLVFNEQLKKENIDGPSKCVWQRVHSRKTENLGLVSIFLP